MPSFKRALKAALVHRLTVVVVVATSVIIAVLWGGNLTVVYPIVEVIMNDHSLPEWVDQKIDVAQHELHDTQRWLARLDNLQGAKQVAIPALLQTEIENRRNELNELLKKFGATGDDLQVAEKIRLSNDITHLEAIANLPADRIAGKLSQERRDAERNIRVYSASLKRCEWLAPTVRRWMPTTPFKTLLVVFLFAIIGTVIKNAFRFWNGMAVAKLGNLVGYDLRMDFYRQILRFDMANFTEAGRGDLMNRCTSDLNAVNQGIQRIFGQALLEPLKLLACFVGAAWVSWQLLLLTIIGAPLAGYSIHYLGKALKRTHRKAMQELSSIYETLAETLGGIKLIKAFNMEPAERNKFHQSAKVYYHRQMRIAMYNNLVSPVVETLGVAIVVVGAIMGGYLVLGQHTHIFGIKISDMPLNHGDMSLFFVMLAGMSDPARRLSGEFSNIQQALAAADRVYEVLDREPAIVDPVNPVSLPALTSSLNFENVCFEYHSEKSVLRGVNLEVRAGETIAIVGPNGCGKTTLLQLLPRFYDPTSGRVTIQGVDVRDVRLRDLRQRFGLVSQEILMFNDTVENNIRYGKPDATTAEIQAAARKAHAHSFIVDKLPDGYQTLVGPAGSRLSGGQRQRISLARAILRNPEILLLDEATSQIDIESEQLIFEVLKEFSRDRTTFMITHRVSMISLADRVIVMDHGKIADIGTHDELVGRCDLYRRLCHFGYRESA